MAEKSKENKVRMQVELKVRRINFVVTEPKKVSVRWSRDGKPGVSSEKAEVTPEN